VADILSLNRSPQDRLQSALRLLALAQDEQRAALNAFRESLYELRDSTSRLQASVHGWQRQVSETGRELNTARAAVATLQKTAARL
jgi:chromosome segregation ATPase